MDSWTPQHHDVALRRQRRGLAGPSCMDLDLDAPPRPWCIQPCRRHLDMHSKHHCWQESRRPRLCHSVSTWRFGFLLLLWLGSTSVSPVVVLSGQRDGQFPQPNNNQASQDALSVAGCSLTNHGTALPPTRPHPQWNDDSSPDGWGETDRKHGAGGQPRQKTGSDVRAGRGYSSLTGRTYQV